MPEALDPKALAELTTEIVAAYVAHQQVAATDVPALIEAVGRRLARLAAAEETREEETSARPAPAVPVRRSVTPEHLVCLVCGQRVKTLKRHLRVAHGLTPAAYREAFGLKRDYPLVAPAYAARRAAIARAMGLGGPRPAQPRPRGDRGAKLRLPRGASSSAGGSA